jgi:hypothetical protein
VPWLAIPKNLPLLYRYGLRQERSPKNAVEPFPAR